MLEGLVRPDSGEIRVLGMDWRTQGAMIRTRIGVQFQSTELDDHVKVREAEVLCDRVGIMDKGQILQLGTPRELIAGLHQPSFAEVEVLGTAPDARPFAERLGLPVERRRLYRATCTWGPNWPCASSWCWCPRHCSCSSVPSPSASTIRAAI
jgi:ABC-type multidrug transport system ATPase subunit